MWARATLAIITTALLLALAGCAAGAPSGSGGTTGGTGTNSAGGGTGDADSSGTGTGGAGGSGTGTSSTGTGGAGGSGTGTGGASTASSQPSQIIGPGESLVIATAEISSTATFFPLQVDGTTMEVLAVRAPDGTIRTAFNTCEVCFDSGQGYYKQSGDVLVCQNCGNRFALSKVEVEASGCNPWPIFAKDKVQSEQSITIGYDFLAAQKQVFDNWKRRY